LRTSYNDKLFVFCMSKYRKSNLACQLKQVVLALNVVDSEMKQKLSHPCNIQMSCSEGFYVNMDFVLWNNWSVFLLRHRIVLLILSGQMWGKIPRIHSWRDGVDHDKHLCGQIMQQ